MAKTNEEARQINRESVKKYHTKITDIKVRVPNEEYCGVNYIQLMKDRAVELGYVTGKNEIKPNVNAYILSLISKDIGVNIERSASDFKRID